MSDIALRVEGLGKRYRLGLEHGGVGRYKSLRDSLVGMARRPIGAVRNTFVRKPMEEANSFWALKDINFEVKRGEVLGIIGRNGAGKSTLLKILSQITKPTVGRVALYGRVGSLLEVGTGFHPELTGRENIYLNGAILGMTGAEVKRRFDEIVAFSEVEKFLDTAVKHYSSGMYMRLAFAVAAHLDPEILVVDEVLSVGDAEFQKKCLGKMGDVAREGRTILFVSHNMAAVRSLCGRGVLLRAGGIVVDSDVNVALENYLEPIKSSGGNHIIPSGVPRSGSGELVATGIRILSPNGRTLEAIPWGAPFDIEVSFLARKAARGICVSIDVDSVEGYRLTTLFSGFLNEEFDVEAGEGKFICRVQDLPLVPDRYRLGVFLGERHAHCDFVRDAATVEVASADVFGSGRLPERAHGATVSSFSWRAA